MIPMGYITYDTILDSSRELWFEEKKSIFYCSLKKIANDAITDINYPDEKSELLLRLYFEGCCILYTKESNSIHLETFCIKHKKILLKWYENVYNDLIEDTRIRQNLDNLFGRNINFDSLNERQQRNYIISKDFFEYVETNNFTFKDNYHRGVIKLSNSNNKILRNYFNINI